MNVISTFYKAHCAGVSSAGKGEGWGAWLPPPSPPSRLPLSAGETARSGPGGGVSGKSCSCMLLRRVLWWQFSFSTMWIRWSHAKSKCLSTETSMRVITALIWHPWSECLMGPEFESRRRRVHSANALTSQQLWWISWSDWYRPFSNCDAIW